MNSVRTGFVDPLWGRHQTNQNALLCNAIFHFNAFAQASLARSKGGINYVDPYGGDNKPIKMPCYAMLFFIFTPSLKRAWRGVKMKNAPPLAGHFDWFGGEWGIRTPDTVTSTAV
jgi:hypothetical protein